MTNVIGLLDVHDREPTMTEQTMITPEFVSGVRLHPMGEIIAFTGFTDMPGVDLPAASIERRVANRFFMTRTGARALIRDLNKLLSAGN